LGRKPFIGNSTQNRVRQTLNTFHQLQGETFSTSFEIFKDLLLECAHHGFEKIRLIQILYEVLDYPIKMMVESLCNGAFTNKIANDA